MSLRSTHTRVVMDVSPETFQEIHDKMKEAGYHHAIYKDEDGITVDMSGLAIRKVKVMAATSHDLMPHIGELDE